MGKTKLALFIVLLSCVACSKTPDVKDLDQQKLQQQQAQQGYPILIASPEIADYALPFCEKKYCIEVEIFDFNSQDQWFNQFTDQQIADLIRQKLALKQKMSLQAAVDQFVILSDEWQAQTENQSKKAWSLYIKPRVATQQGEIALLQINAEYDVGEEKVPAQDYYFVVDRKKQQMIRLYDIIAPKYRAALTDVIQQHYQDWQQQWSVQQQQAFTGKQPEKLYWANQDWFFDDQGIAIYYRGTDLSTKTTKNLVIYLTPEQTRQWVLADYLQQFHLL
ncbi:hypothetical protein GCM10023206_28460 [Acinetobacter puyangensis]|uniref:DUF3298 domain-containing protein n=1 Tax=Acinetobacter puyangensis TaxID=1096779 RepID=A0A240E496_9GAMM|nr:hypothetical protein [Acinetobacter puyangensis]SNX43386.1 hypothetical protein SAMN05421731_101422 [Acinetobacter puyangensis]